MAMSQSSSRQAPGFYRFRIGAFEAIALHDGVAVRERPAGFVRNAPDAEVGEAYAAAGMARDKLTLTYTALAIRTGNGTVLIDTGLGEGGLANGAGQIDANLAAAGLSRAEIGTVIISHFHGDHIAGLLRADGAAAFPNAEILVPEQEWAFWSDEARRSAAPDGLKPHFATAKRVFDPLTRSLRRYRWGEELLPGFTSVKANGHTPGMSAIEIVSGDSATMYVADITNTPLVFARHPEWQALFDIDPEQATATRKALLDRAAADKLRLHFFHAPFPATGYIVKSGAGYEYIPALWSAT
jgi:glyoxylase-like metal-dependent hydrolase (beta-lactamase superfamily II)